MTQELLKLLGGTPLNLGNLLEQALHLRIDRVLGVKLIREQRITPDGLRRMTISWRYPLLLVFLRQELAETGDEILDLLDKIIVKIERDADQDHTKWMKTVDKARRERAQYFAKASVILDAAILDPAVRAEVYKRVPKQLLTKITRPCRPLSLSVN